MAGNKAPSTALATTALMLSLVSYPLLSAGGLGLFTAALGLVFSVCALILTLAAPARYAGRGAAAGGLVVSLVVFLAIAVMTPHFFGPRRPYSPVGEIRSLQSVQVAYASSNDGAYGSLSCLAAPTQCGFETGTTPFIDSDLAALKPMYGYRRLFIPGAPRVGSPDVRGIATFAYVAVPTKPGETGVRGFCGDDTGRICFTTDGTAPPVRNGRCAPDCVTLR